MRMSSKTWDGGLALGDETGINGQKEAQKVKSEYLREDRVWEGREKGTHSAKWWVHACWGGGWELGCTYPSKRTVPVC